MSPNSIPQTLSPLGDAILSHMTDRQSGTGKSSSKVFSPLLSPSLDLINDWNEFVANPFAAASDEPVLLLLSIEKINLATLYKESDSEKIVVKLTCSYSEVRYGHDNTVQEASSHTQLCTQQSSVTSSIVLSRETDQKQELHSPGGKYFTSEVVWRNKTHSDFVFPCPDRNAKSATPHRIAITIQQSPSADKGKGSRGKFCMVRGLSLFNSLFFCLIIPFSIRITFDPCVVHLMRRVVVMSLGIGLQQTQHHPTRVATHARRKFRIPARGCPVFHHALLADYHRKRLTQVGSPLSRPVNYSGRTKERCAFLHQL